MMIRQQSSASGSLTSHPIALRTSLRDQHRQTSFLRESAAGREWLHDSHALAVKDLAREFREQSQQWRRDEASQELFFACMSFILLLAAALADFFFRF